VLAGRTEQREGKGCRRRDKGVEGSGSKAIGVTFQAEKKSFKKLIQKRDVYIFIFSRVFSFFATGNLINLGLYQILGFTDPTSSLLSHHCPHGRSATLSEQQYSLSPQICTNNTQHL
jgi:hypothetical protein